MKFELKNFLINICGWIIIISMGFFLAVFVIFSEDKVQQPFKETLTLTLSFLSALATIGAAIIAARIFQTWKTQHSYVEQLKILSQMLEIVSEIQKSLEDARTNKLLVEIILGLQTKPNLETLFFEQAEKVNITQNHLHTLFRLENQIYLLNNDKRDKPVFNDIAGEDCPVIALLEYTEKLHEDMLEIYHLLNFDFAGNYLSYEEFDVDKKEIQRLVLNVIKDASLYIYIGGSKDNLEIDNSINIQLTNWLRGLDQRIMKYKDSLDNLN
ncbi:hypothetical protein [Acinetobacter pittii]|uniref:hypothetical protein n=1 Tax=Acinetobacter pittii TaxID=48296 RepID=UPI00301C235C